MTLFPNGTILGYPRIGSNRELKRALEATWRGRIDHTEFAARTSALRLADLTRLAELGLNHDDASIPLETAHYDHVLDATLTFGAVPPRLRDSSVTGLDWEWLLARGDADHAPLEMTKWFDTNYHYLVPELDADTQFALADTRIVERFAEAKAAGFLTRPVIVGPATYLALAKAEGIEPLALAERLVPVYRALAEQLAAAGATWLQIDEPSLVADLDDIDPAALAAITADAVAAVQAGGLKALVAVGYGNSVGRVESLAGKADAIAVDLVRGQLPDLGETPIIAGVVHGRNVWRTDLDAALAKLQQIPGDVSVGTSTPLLHVPHSLAPEDELSDELISWLAFADEKVAEVVALSSALATGERTPLFDEARAALASRETAEGVHVEAVRERIAGLTADARSRAPYDERAAAQREQTPLPQLPTTTIGSFPQTDEIRVARAAHAKGESTDEQYREALRAEVRRVIDLQTELGLDVLVHGEPERNDMVQYFAENFDGFAVTKRGWVQSYGSRATRPSLLWGDVSRPDAFTVEWISYAQSLTDKPVKGMLTGPVTILAWSFVRDDQPLADTADQVALALADEIADLEAAGISIIQVDEPALRELLPLRQDERDAYLDWSVGSFRLATGGAASATQIHTHLCYSEFNTIIDAIDGLDADVTSIEAARSKMEVVEAIANHGYSRGIGPGVYDIHSPRVPSLEEIAELIDIAAANIPGDLLWINPDCGLKTRGYQETAASLQNLVDAAKRTTRVDV